MKAVIRSRYMLGIVTAAYIVALSLLWPILPFSSEEAREADGLLVPVLLMLGLSALAGLLGVSLRLLGIILLAVSSFGALAWYQASSVFTAGSQPLVALAFALSLTFFWVAVPSLITWAVGTHFRLRTEKQPAGVS
jgi:hypothetical protein